MTCSIDKFKKLLLDKKLKFTYERNKIFEEITRIDKHFDADGLYERFKIRKERISRDTVYRTIPLLLEAGIIQKSVGSGKREFFEKLGDHGHHDHMVCVECGRFIEFISEEIERIQAELCKKQGFRLMFHDHRLFGYCKDCSEAQKSS